MGLKRVNKTENKLQVVWEQLDEASGNVYNALHSLERMVDLPEEIKGRIEQVSNHVQTLDSLKFNIEELIEEKKQS